MTTHHRTTAQLRWMVRREALPTKFGDRPNILWAVTPYIARDPHTLALIGALTPTRFASRTAAIAYARRAMTRHYQRTTR